MKEVNQTNKNFNETQSQLFITTSLKAILSGFILSFTINGVLIFLARIHTLLTMADFMFYIKFSPICLGLIGFIIIISFFRFFKKLFLWKTGAILIFVGFFNFLIRVYFLFGKQ
jgi:hypothetical protein